MRTAYFPRTQCPGASAIVDQAMKPTRTMLASAVLALSALALAAPAHATVQADEPQPSDSRTARTDKTGESGELLSPVLGILSPVTDLLSQ